MQSRPAPTTDQSTSLTYEWPNTLVIKRYMESYKTKRGDDATESYTMSVDDWQDSAVVNTSNFISQYSSLGAFFFQGAVSMTKTAASKLSGETPIPLPKYNILCEELQKLLDDVTLKKKQKLDKLISNVELRINNCKTTKDWINCILYLEEAALVAQRLRYKNKQSQLCRLFFGIIDYIVSVLVKKTNLASIEFYQISVVALADAKKHKSRLDTKEDDENDGVTPAMREAMYIRAGRKYFLMTHSLEMFEELNNKYLIYNHLMPISFDTNSKSFDPKKFKFNTKLPEVFQEYYFHINYILSNFSKLNGERDSNSFIHDVSEEYKYEQIKEAQKELEKTELKMKEEKIQEELRLENEGKELENAKEALARQQQELDEKIKLREELEKARQEISKQQEEIKNKSEELDKSQHLNNDKNTPPIQPVSSDSNKQQVAQNDPPPNATEILNKSGGTFSAGTAKNTSKKQKNASPPKNDSKSPSPSSA